MTLVDTSSWIESLRRTGDAAVRDRVRALLLGGEAAWCDMVRLELWNGARGSDEKKVLETFERDLPLLPTSVEVWQLACEMARRARGAGLTIPSTDLLILACARFHRVDLEHCDAHMAEARRVLGA